MTTKRPNKRTALRVMKIIGLCENGIADFADSPLEPEEYWNQHPVAIDLRFLVRELPVSKTVDRKSFFYAHHASVVGMPFDESQAVKADMIRKHISWRTVAIAMNKVAAKYNLE